MVRLGGGGGGRLEGRMEKISSTIGKLAGS